MSDVVWYSASTRRVCIIEGAGAVTNEVSVWVFRAADDRAAAMRRLVDLAKAQDKEYLNADGERVRWALVSVESLDELGDGEMRDREVHSKMSEIDPPDGSLSLETIFAPEMDEPGLSGVMPWGD